MPSQFLNSWDSRLPQFPSAGILATDGSGNITSPQLLALPTTTATVGQVTINGTSFLHSFGTNNAFLGTASGNFTLTAQNCTGLGNGTLNAITSGGNNCCAGNNSAKLLTTGSNNCGFGAAALRLLVDGINNVAMGYSSMLKATSAAGNIALGYYSLANIGGVTGLLTGQYNIHIDALGECAYTDAESSNILIRNNGVVGESNKMRLGTSGAGAGQVNKTFIAGITGITPDTAGALVNITDSSGQLGTITNGTAGWVLTSNGVAANPSFQAASGGGLTYAEETGATKTIVINFEYGANRGGGVAFTLPAAAAVGTRFAITGIAGLWSIVQRAGQYIVVDETTTTVGAGGSLTATNAGNSFTATCTVADLGWTVTSMMGNITIV